MVTVLRPDFAGAVEAVMLSAGATGRLELRPERLPGAVVPDLQVARCHGEVALDGGARLPLEVEALDKIGVLRRKRRDQRPEALAEGAFILVRLVSEVDLSDVDRRRMAPARPIRIRDRVSEDRVKPRDQLLLVGERVDALDGLQQARLDDVFRQLCITELSAGEGNEALARRDQFVEIGCRHGRSIAAILPGRWGVIQATALSIISSKENA